ncbi:hypothetical protein [Spiribacter vilamensis]|uniref:Uncharacterized protein n=1 Tax=Spiribacter vilamensis TaxID=531306 RepID=A0A4Q8D0G7_9GAMM|nr:hypothetical protein [Spiribacter vilamensis]RZU98783.1 hypothetical protein EV698_1045 [Spiribacter vilamensis]TVO62196.1 hypothetical protein FPL09_08985 [Spiribacter vilamensis]
MSAQIGTAAEIVEAAVADYRDGDPKPLIAMVRAGITEVLECSEAREIIATALQGRGAPQDVRARQTRLRLIVFMHMAVGYGITARSDTGKAPRISVAEIAPRFFPFSEHTVNEYWKNHNGGNYWLRAREIGAKAKRDGLDREDALQKFAQMGAEDVFTDNLHDAREAAACGELYRHEKENTPRLKRQT